MVDATTQKNHEKTFINNYCHCRNIYDNGAKQ